MRIGPNHLDDGARDDDAVEAIERRADPRGEAESVHSNPHLKDEESEKEELCVVEEVGEPLRLGVVLHGHRARVEKDDGDDEPEPV